MPPRAPADKADGHARRGSRPIASLPGVRGSCDNSTVRVQIDQACNPGADGGGKRLKGGNFRETTVRVLTSWHTGCTFIVSQTRTGAILEAESQQNADGLGASLDCRRSALSERREIMAGWTTSARWPLRRGVRGPTTSSAPPPARSNSHGSAWSHPVEPEAADYLARPLAVLRDVRSIQ